MSDNLTMFQLAVSGEHAELQKYLMVSPIASVGNGDMTLVFKMDVRGEEDVVENDFITVPTIAVETYQSTNNVSVRSLSPEGIDAYQKEVVSEALKILPEEEAYALLLDGLNVVMVPDPDSRKSEDFVLPDGAISSTELVKMYNDLTPDTANELLRNGLVESISDYLLYLGNSPGEGIDIQQVEKLHERLKIALDLPDYANSLRLALEGDLATKFDIPSDQLTEFKNVLMGEEAPGTNTVLNISHQKQ